MLGFRTKLQHSLRLTLGQPRNFAVCIWSGVTISCLLILSRMGGNPISFPEIMFAVCSCSGLVLFGYYLIFIVSRLREVNDDVLRKARLLEETLENMDQGLVMIDSNGIVAIHNRRFNELLEMDEAFTRSKPHYMELRKRFVASGEYASSDPVFQQWIADGSLKPEHAVYRRVRPNGSVLEVRNTLLPGGGAVRTYADVTAQVKAENELEASEARYRLVVDNAGDLIMLACANPARRYVSPSILPMLGYTPEEAIHLTLKDFLFHEDVAPTYAIAFSLNTQNPNGSTILRLRRKDQGFIWSEIRFQHVVLGEDVGVVCAIRDISKRRATEIALAEKSEFLQITLDNMDQGLIMFDENQIVQVCNLRAKELLDLPEEFMSRKPEIKEVIEYQFQQNEFVKSDKAFRDLINSGGFYLMRDHYERERPNGVVLEVSTIPIPGGGSVRTYNDITARKAAERRITHASRHDVLTNLPNRLLFQERLDQYIADVNRNGSSFAILYVDLDRFKSINDSLGHHIGDQLLYEVTARLTALIRAEDTMARLGGDEFAILMGHAEIAHSAGTLAERLIYAMDEPIIIESHILNVGISIGIALAPEHGLVAEQLVKAADVALYRAKKGGRRTFRFYRKDMDADIANRRALELCLRDALKNNELSLVYQPVMNVADGQMTSCEALLRWNHPVHGPVSPGEFIPLAEETGLIVPIGDWVMQEACRMAASWGGHIGIAVNISTLQFDSKLVSKIVSSLAISGLDPHRLELEITESVLMQDQISVFEILQQIRALGVRIALDDFGTGFSSLSYLRRFPLDTIKIDQSFIRAIEDPKTSSIIDAIVRMGTDFKVKIVAEGVETAKELALIVEKGCTHVQGYLLSRPIPGDDVLHFEKFAPAKRQESADRQAAA